MKEKYQKGNKNPQRVHPMPINESDLPLKSDGSMDYMEKQEKFNREDSSRIKRNSFKDSRY